METRAEYKTKSQHGGKRANAGRKPSGNVKRLHAFRLSEETFEQLKQIGKGDATRGIELAAAEARPKSSRVKSSKA